MTLATIAPAESYPVAERSKDRPPLEAPLHGHGKLYRGGVRGHRGGSGRRPDKVRRALLGVASIGITRVLKRLIEGQPLRVIDRDGSVVEIDPNPADRLRAVEIALKYGLGTANNVNVNASARAETQRPLLILPELGSEPTEADLARWKCLRPTEDVT